jgi:small subunit ribosomal protein S8
MSIDTIGNLLTIIRNGLMASKASVTVLSSKMNLALVQVLKDEGFIRDFVQEVDEKDRAKINVFLKYVEGESVIHEITRISKPSLRKYTGHSTIRPVIGGLGISILTTNKGIMTNKKAKELGVGGEVICTVW